MLELIEEKRTQLYLNNCGITCIGSPKMLEGIEEGKAMFFTVKMSEFKELLSKAIPKKTGHRFEGCEPYLIPNSYLEIHVENNFGILDESVALQFRKRADNRGINIFASKPDNEIRHTLAFEKFPEKDEYYNELYLSTKIYRDKFYISILPV